MASRTCRRMCRSHSSGGSKPSARSTASVKDSTSAGGACLSRAMSPGGKQKPCRTQMSLKSASNLSGVRTAWRECATTDLPHCREKNPTRKRGNVQRDTEWRTPARRASARSCRVSSASSSVRATASASLAVCSRCGATAFTPNVEATRRISASCSAIASGRHGFYGAASIAHAASRFHDPMVAEGCDIYVDRCLTGRYARTPASAVGGSGVLTAPLPYPPSTPHSARRRTCSRSRSGNMRGWRSVPNRSRGRAQ